MKLVAFDAAQSSLIDPADRHLLDLFDSWTAGLLDGLDPDRRREIATYLRWGQRRRLAQAATTGTFTTWSTLSLDAPIGLVSGRVASTKKAS